MNKLAEFTKDQLRSEALPLEIGSTVKVHCKIKEGSRERKSIACPPSLQLGVGEASGQPQCGAFTHGCSVLVQILGSENWKSE